MMYGWNYKQFKTSEKMQAWIEKHRNKVQFVEVFINNGYALEYRKLLRIY